MTLPREFMTCSATHRKVHCPDSAFSVIISARWAAVSCGPSSISIPSPAKDDSRVSLLLCYRDYVRDLRDRQLTALEHRRGDHGDRLYRACRRSACSRVDHGRSKVSLVAASNFGRRV